MNIKVLKDLRENINIFYNSVNCVYKVVDKIENNTEYFGKEDLAKDHRRKLILTKIRDKNSSQRYKKIK